MGFNNNVSFKRWMACVYAKDNNKNYYLDDKDEWITEVENARLFAYPFDADLAARRTFRKIPINNFSCVIASYHCSINPYDMGKLITNEDVC